MRHDRLRHGRVFGLAFQGSGGEHSDPEGKAIDGTKQGSIQTV
jgi:hypothetical protein